MVVNGLAADLVKMVPTVKELIPKKNLVTLTNAYLVQPNGKNGASAQNHVVEEKGNVQK